MSKIIRTATVLTVIFSASLVVAAQMPTEPSATPVPLENKTRTPDVPFVPTPTAVVNAMLSVARVTKNDVVYDLGSGDGRIVIAAAKKYGARGVGIDISASLVAQAKAAATAAGVDDKVTFIEGDLFEQDLSKATVVTLYLLPAVNLKLKPTLLKLKPGTRIVSHAFDMGDWKPEKTEIVDGRSVYFWTVPQPAK